MNCRCITVTGPLKDDRHDTFKDVVMPVFVCLKYRDNEVSRPSGGRSLFRNKSMTLL
jgi:hypothetical protein